MIKKEGIPFTTDFCSVPGWLGLFPFFRKYSKLFRTACAAHDWFYHNAYWLEMTQDECDAEFYKIMVDVALSQTSYKEVKDALIAAKVYYIGVRIGGHKAFRKMLSLWRDYEASNV